ncbi:MAG: single-stranded-DNA-specific exonuclease RecJ [Fimbriimonas sp.]|nr:single-stranded-DNA-specific exonuclease RecJ [Fimbriimonas sp.]
MDSAAPHARWLISARNKKAELRLQQELGVPSLVAAILAQRGYDDPAKAEEFLNPSLDRLHDPALLPDYMKARDAILGAKERGELIFVHGDYDVDGITSAALLNRFLLAIGCKVHTHVPHRMKEGYGIHKSAVAAAQAAGAKLFLTCDCGISAHEQVELAREAGMTVVVTDHHTVTDELPNAEAVVNPHRRDSIYPFTELSGAGVVFKLCEGLTRELGHEPQNYYRGFLDLAALGTIADVMPLIGENRIIAKFGLMRLADSKKAGIKALIQASKISVEVGKPLRASQVGFQLGPRLNAAGRISDAAMALRLLLENDMVVAEGLARQIEAVNTERKAEQQRVSDEAVDMVLSSGSQNRNVIVVAKEGWHSGIIGIVAGRLVEQFFRPTFVLTIDRASGLCKGSARTIPNFHLADAIRAHPDLMTGGGHAMAAGCSIKIEDLVRATDALDTYAGERLTPEDFMPSVRVDMEVESREVTLEAAESLTRLEPFGFANPEPVFVARQMALAQIQPTKNPAHVRLMLRSPHGVSAVGIAFGIGERLTQMGSGAVGDMLFQASVNEWKGARSLNWQVKDFQSS